MSSSTNFVGADEVFLWHYSFVPTNNKWLHENMNHQRAKLLSRSGIMHMGTASLGRLGLQPAHCSQTEVTKINENTCRFELLPKGNFHPLVIISIHSNIFNASVFNTASSSILSTMMSSSAADLKFALVVPGR